VSRTSASASVEVDVDPQTAFQVFTEEIDLWWVRGPINFHDASRLAELRMEPGVGGRILEIYDEASGDMLETARITVWEPGIRLILRGTVQDTETDIRFVATDNGTRVEVEQYLVPGGDPTTIGFGWVNMLDTFVAWCSRRSSAPCTPREHSRLGIVLAYENPAAAARWLRTVFQLGSWDIDAVPEQGERWIEFHVGDSLVILVPLDGKRPADAPVTTHMARVYVDDLDAHVAHAKANGATIVRDVVLHGERTYVAEDLEGYRWIFAQARPTMR
jgi:uncharacterized glyoxalase superfamily protein PhnB